MDQLDIGYDSRSSRADTQVLHVHAVLGVVLAMDILTHAFEDGALQDDAVCAVAGIDVAQCELVEGAGIAEGRPQLEAGTAWRALVASAVEIELFEIEPPVRHTLHTLDHDHVLTRRADPTDLRMIAVGSPRHAFVLALLEDNRRR